MAGRVGGVSGASTIWTLAKNDATALITGLDELADMRLL